ncbi:MAG: PHP domain-containing protein [bacterium]
MAQADLHIHTHFSDSSLSPEEIVEYAKGIGLKIIGITDHDSVEGIDEALKYAKPYDIEVIPGVELSAERENGELHILGYFIDWKNKWFNDELKIFRQTREKRAHLIISKLKELNVNIDYEQVIQVVKKNVGNEAISRLHIATVLHQRKMVDSIKDAFEKYLNYGAKAYVPKFSLTPKQAIEMILKTGGIPVLAHPYFSKCNENLILELVKCGLKGIEVFHPQQNIKGQQFCQKMAQKYNLVMTGGSDCHGLFKESISIGMVTVDENVVKCMKGMVGRR